MKRVLLLVDDILASTELLLHGLNSHNSTLRRKWLVRACDAPMLYKEKIAAFAPDVVVYFSLSYPLEKIQSCFPNASIIRIGPENAHIGINEERIAQMAARHLQERAYPYCAIIADERFAFLRRRIDAFTDRMSQTSTDVQVIPIKGSPSPWLRAAIDPKEEAQLKARIAELPKPCGIFCMSTRQAIAIESFCVEIGLSIPSEIGLLGVDGSSITPIPGLPGISYIDIPWVDIGMTAGIMIEKLLKNPLEPLEPKLFVGTSVIEGGSTENYGGGDAEVGRSIQYIRENLTKPLNVGKLVKHSGLCRTLLERRFKEIRKRTPLAEIHYWRLQSAKNLLQKTNLRVSEVAERCGFSDALKFSAFFSKQMGMPPTRFREQNNCSNPENQS